MPYVPRSQVYLNRVHRIKSLDSFESILEEARSDRRLTTEEYQAIKMKIQRRGLNVWFDKTTRAFRAIHRMSYFPYPEDLPSELEEGIPYLGRDIEAWAIRAMISSDQKTQRIGRQILREYFSGRYEKVPLQPAGRSNRNSHHLKADTYYNVRVKDLRVKDGQVTSLKVFVYRDYDHSPQSYSWPPYDSDVNW